jgi:hypothetical protein
VKDQVISFQVKHTERPGFTLNAAQCTWIYDAGFQLSKIRMQMCMTMDYIVIASQSDSLHNLTFDIAMKNQNPSVIDPAIKRSCSN